MSDEAKTREEGEGARVVPIGAGRKRREADEAVELVEVWILEGTQLLFFGPEGEPRLMSVPRAIHLFLPPDQLEDGDDDEEEGWAS